ncbi:hypothetical protein GCM10022243_20380 [Saccharothrix violaceirubra]|uniref:histidine kinase n=1 Tax=Saccharothrix violaceirubra TaxID=413306 RepID=A0A7W7WV85_9PSEU|nr:ATP-binding protein [Saccharothrix violaceirubra]MBB4965059.1 signal transduction histidine kinase [Saccharothrix violaceirubra]
MTTAIRLVCALLPVLWAGVTSWVDRFSVVEVVGYGTAVAVALVAARRHPAGIVLAAAAWQVGVLSRLGSDNSVPLAALSPALVLTAYVAGRHVGHARAAVVALVGSGLVGAIAGAVVTGTPDTVVLTLAGIAVAGAVPWAFGRHRRLFAAMVEAGWDRAERLERDVVRARDRERARLAAEMHDLVGHELARAALLVGALEVSPTLPDDQRRAAHEARAGVTAAAERLADTVRLLRGPESRSPDESVQAVVDAARATGLDVDADTADLAGVDPVIDRTVHRVLAESLTNAMKHAPGSKVRITLTRDDGITLVVANGPPAAKPTHTGSRLGLVGLTERVSLVGGRFDAGPQGEGFAVHAHLPERPVATEPTRSSAATRVRHSARHVTLVTVAVVGGAAVLALGYMVFDAVTSTLRPAVYDRLRVGAAQADVLPLLPDRTRVDGPPVEAPPPDWTCSYYSTHPNPFDGRRLDLYRVCFADGRLVGKDLLTRDP